MSSTADTQEAAGQQPEAVSDFSPTFKILNKGDSARDGSNDGQISSSDDDAAATDCIQVLFPPTREQHQEEALQAGQIFEVLNKIGDIRWIDFSNFHLDHTVVVVYFDLRAAQRAYTRLNEDSSIVAEFYDSRACASINASVGAPGLKLKPATGPDRAGGLHTPGSSGGSCSGAQRAAMMGYQQPRVVPVESGSGSVAPPPELPEKASCVSESVGSSRKYPKTTAVPNSQFVIDLGKVASGADPRTTCMIRNIPNKYTQKMLLKLFDSVPSICGQYDFFYLPMDFRNKCNVGYAFIDFSNPRTSIPALVRALDGKKWERFNSEKICRITFARLQGSKQLMDHFRTSSVMQQSNKQIRPWFQRDRSAGHQQQHHPHMSHSSGDRSRHYQLSEPVFERPTTLTAASSDAGMNYDNALADLCAIGEPSLLATALAELQRNEEDPSSVILDNFPLEGWSDAASSIGGFSAPATYFSGQPCSSALQFAQDAYNHLDSSPPPGWSAQPDDRWQTNGTEGRFMK
ncbi:hypothetical protein Pmar_PMAR010898 [Perkinsus marinus ATCC 50983]|uniref:RRM domain-containing protein n=1 Tax=Perkinsus marinus (strain ATCC 50983 / TXsc) TaxID=423536 RepID=C5LUA2_PERM5|nr:hypothetical protein Pmar_PMAR010898 [Perkinsus marinus ATCC 50983]EEQ99635.1 hypothetical protein Pmar_PMAR010898 [Perkinsus marinus ATCC 50983]|eukprot:XP_002766918.1 hypothetical protein Pmar_PMAR010898 [Perkinsus marinus ATCC 50983]